MADARQIMDMSRFGVKADQARQEHEQMLKQQQKQKQPAKPSPAQMPPQLVKETAKILKQGMEKKMKQKEIPQKVNGLRKIRQFREYFPKLFTDKKEHAHITAESSVEEIEATVAECSDRVTLSKAPDLMEQLWKCALTGIEWATTLYNPLDLKLDSPNKLSKIGTSEKFMAKVKPDLLHLQVLYGIQPPSPLISLAFELSYLITAVSNANKNQELLEKKVDNNTQAEFSDL